MKIIKKHLAVLAAPALLAGMMLLNGCDKLPLQKNHSFEPNTLDPQQNMTAWDYLNKPRTDTLFNMMVRAIKYAGLEEEYKKPNRTFIVLAAQAITSRNVTTGVEATNTFFARKPINGAPGKTCSLTPKLKLPT